MSRNVENITLEEKYLIFKEIERSEILNQRDFAAKTVYSPGENNFQLATEAQRSQRVKGLSAVLYKLLFVHVI